MRLDVPNDLESENVAADVAKVKEEMEVYFFQPLILKVTCLIIPTVLFPPKGECMEGRRASTGFDIESNES